MNNSGSTSNAGTSNAGSSSGAATTGGRHTAAPLTPEADLSTYISTTLKGHGKKTLEEEVPVNYRPYLKTTPAKITQFDNDVNAFVKKEVEREKKVSERQGSANAHTTPELKFTDELQKLSTDHDLGYIGPCKNEPKTGGDLLCAVHVEHVKNGKTTKIFAVVQMKVAERFQGRGPVVNFSHTNPKLQLELLAKEVIRRRAEFASDVDVLGAYGATFEERLVFMPLDEILEHYKGPQVDMTQEYRRKVTADLLSKYGHSKSKGFLEEMVEYVEKRDAATSPGTSSPMKLDSGKNSPNAQHGNHPH
ncbi:hypothetical protein FRC17_000686 [Serendipita sp. 399]|nr:hypothetical protein FRC17_000686 [Serendipita sp. 399]